MDWLVTQCLVPQCSLYTLLFLQSSGDFYIMVQGSKRNVLRAHVLRQQLQSILKPTHGCPGTSFSLYSVGQGKSLKPAQTQREGNQTSPFDLSNSVHVQAGKESATFFHCLPSSHNPHLSQVQNESFSSRSPRASLYFSSRSNSRFLSSNQGEVQFLGSHTLNMVSV